MRTRQYANLIQITAYPTVFPVNCYLVVEDDGLTAIDTGLPASAQAVIQEARNRQRPIARIALTHAHFDHVAGLDALHAAYPEAAVLLSAREARILAGDKSLDPSEPQVPLKGSPARCATQPTGTLQPGDRVGSLQVVAAPGHTPGQIAFLDTRDGTLIAGDALQTRGGIAVAGVVRPTFPFPAMGTWHKPTALQSAKQLAALAPSRLAVGHGDVLTELGAAMEQAIRTAERRFRNT